MDSYLILKLLHIISATVLAGTGIGIAFFMLMAGRSGNAQAVAVTARNVVLADWIFTTPAIVIQFITGIWLMKILHYSFSSAWFIVVISLFIFIGCCWIPVVFIQYRLKNIVECQDQDDVLDARFRKLMALWTALGIPAFLGIVIMFWLMVFKPLVVT
jgi:uncharacterized membrane protein